MSRAFVKEPDGDQVSDDQPEWPISTHANYVTAEGLELLNKRREHLIKEQQKLTDDIDDMSAKVSLNQIGRELRYLNARLASAKLIRQADPKSNTVSIGSTVNVIDEHGASHTFTIVGEDEADIKLGKISWISPLANALLDKHLGDEVTWKRPIGDLNVEISEIRTV
ncbi:MAG: GreA/GreB family elongation factor [Pseudomonadota bacterium]|nr:GreA/GreB family elongation factor [Pseudomonadota bacterium]